MIISGTHFTYMDQFKLEQLERLRSEDTPPPHDYPYHWVILDPKSKEDKEPELFLSMLVLRPAYSGKISVSPGH